MSFAIRRQNLGVGWASDTGVEGQGLYFVTL